MIFCFGGVLACVRSRILFCYSRAIPDGPSLSTPGRAVILMSRRLTGMMARRILANFGGGRVYTHQPPAKPLVKVLINGSYAAPPTRCPRLLNIIEPTKVNTS